MNKIESNPIEHGAFDKLLKLLIENDLKNFKATRGRFLNNNPNTKGQGKLFA